MKLEIWNEQEKPEGPVRLRLVQDGDDVYVVVVNENGDRVDDGTPLWFGPDGRVGLAGGLNPNLGFQLDKNGCIVTY